MIQLYFDSYKSSTIQNRHIQVLKECFSHFSILAVIHFNILFSLKNELSEKVKKTNTQIALKVLRVRKCDLTVALNISLCLPQIQNIVRKEKSKKVVLNRPVNKLKII